MEFNFKLIKNYKIGNIFKFSDLLILFETEEAN